MKTTSLTILAFFFITLFTSAQNCDFYYPRTKNAELIYQNYDKNENPNGITSHKVTNYTENAGISEAQIEVKTWDKKNKNTSKSDITVKCEAGIFYFDMKAYINQELISAVKDMEMRIDTKNLETPGKMNVGDSLKDGNLIMDVYNSGLKFMTIEIHITDRFVEAKENVTTPAGTFECYKVTQTVNAKMPMKIVIKTIEWLSPEIGSIKSDSYTSSGKLAARSELIELKK